jgi:hypothetical protein
MDNLDMAYRYNGLSDPEDDGEPLLAAFVKAINGDDDDIDDDDVSTPSYLSMQFNAQMNGTGALAGVTVNGTASLGTEVGLAPTWSTDVNISSDSSSKATEICFDRVMALGQTGIWPASPVDWIVSAYMVKRDRSEVGSCGIVWFTI